MMLKRFKSVSLAVRFHTLRTKLLLSYFLIFMITVGTIGFFSYHKASYSLQREAKQYNSLVLMQASSGIDNLLNEWNRMALVINSHQEILRILSKKDPGQEWEQIQDYSSVKDAIQSTSGFNLNVAAFHILAVDGRSFSMNGKSLAIQYDYKKEEWYHELSTGNKNNDYIEDHVQNDVVDAIQERVLSFAKNIKDTNSLANPTLAYLLIDFKTKAFEQLVANKTGTQGSRYMILDDQNRLMYNSEHADQDYNELKPYWDDLRGNFDVQYRSLSVHNDKVLLSSYKSPYTDWMVVNITPMSNINKDIIEIKSYTLTIALLSGVLVTLVSYFIAQSITSPIRQLRQKMLHMAKGEFPTIRGDYQEDELGLLSKSFDQMSGKINEMIKLVYESEITKKEAEISALQAQINPHFLYNTLATIDSMATIKGNHDVAEMCRALSRLFRYNVELGDMSTISKELEWVGIYLFIEKCRYGERFDYNMSVPSELANVPLMKLLVQPIIENAVIHGLEGKRGKVFLRINVEQTQHGELRIVVEDTGAGIHPDRLEAIQSGLESVNDLYWREQGNESVGLKNVNYRIKLHYGPQFGLALSSVYRECTRVTIALPILEA